MTKKKWHILVLIFLISLSCDEKFVMIKCSECLVTEPIDAIITLTIESDETEFKTTVMLYEGNLEENMLMATFPNPDGELNYSVVINKKYTFRVEYTDILGVKYIAVSSVCPRVKLDLEQCLDFPCYYVYDNHVNMKLKYH